MEPTDLNFGNRNSLVCMILHWKQWTEEMLVNAELFSPLARFKTTGAILKVIRISMSSMKHRGRKIHKVYLWWQIHLIEFKGRFVRKMELLWWNLVLEFSFFDSNLLACFLSGWKPKMSHTSRWIMIIMMNHINWLLMMLNYDKSCWIVVNYA